MLDKEEQLNQRTLTRAIRGKGMATKITTVAQSVEETVAGSSPASGYLCYLAKRSLKARGYLTHPPWRCKRPGLLRET